jgi:dTDP-4-dehydrorhamnose reductase
MRILVTGIQGQVARSLAEAGAAAGETVDLVGRPDIDLETGRGVEETILAAGADVVVSAAAYTAVDKAESDRDAAFAINAEGAGRVAAATAKAGIPVIHLSTDYVFDGLLERPYVEDDRTGPVSVYGASKLEGEHRVAAANPRHVILRTAWVYSPFGSNFLRTMLRLGETRTDIGVVADQRGAPTSALDIADAILTIARGVTGHSAPERFGTFHVTGSGEASWADFADWIFLAAESCGRKPVRVNRIATSDYPTPARRPANSRLNGDKLARIYGLRLSGWQDSTDRVVRRLLTPQQET